MTFFFRRTVAVHRVATAACVGSFLKRCISEEVHESQESGVTGLYVLVSANIWLSIHSKNVQC